MASIEPCLIEPIGYLEHNPNRLSRLEILQQQQHQQYDMTTVQPCEHNCICTHNQPLGNHHHHSNLVLHASSSATPLSALGNAPSNGPYNQHNHLNSNHSHNHMNPHQHMHPHYHDSNLIYNNSSTNSECNQPISNIETRQGPCSHMNHYVPTSNLSVNSQNLNIPNVSCDCGRNCQPQSNHHARQSSEVHSLQSGQSSRIISCDENNPSGTEDGSGMSSSGMITSRRTSKRNLNNLDNQQRLRSSKRIAQGACENVIKPNQEDINYSNNRMDIYSDGGESGVKINDEGTSEDDRPPRLPPRPPPRPRNAGNSGTVPLQPGVRKYVIWCLVCGGILCLLGVMFLAVYFLLRSYTSTVGYFETVPPFVPATLLLLTGLCIISLARRRNRYSYLIKLSGACSLASALTCALVTVTTTVIHMSRLQALRECQYTQKTRTCTCSSVMFEAQNDDMEDGVRFVFDATTDCSVVHGALYSCLRAVFGLSVAGVFVSVFSCMLVYQLLSHERKKMYWEQLELRCRSLYSGAPPGPLPGPAIIGTPRGGPCRCCEQCHAHRVAMPSAYPWDGDTGSRFWGPGQAGNFYSPNPGGDEQGNRVGNITDNGQRNQRSTGWNWPRMPWQRNETSQQNSEQIQSQQPQQQQPQQRFRPSPTSPDSQYGFSNGPNGAASGDGSSSSQQQGGYSVIGAPYGVWGPPPPYSDPNSPARRGRYQYIHPINPCHQQIIEQHIPPTQSNSNVLECHQHNSSTDSHSERFCTQNVASVNNTQQQRTALKRQFKTKDNYENAPSDSDGGPRDRCSNTLPNRKAKKRIEIGANKSIGPNQTQQRINVQNVFNNLQSQSNNQSEASENEYNEPTHPKTEPSSSNPTPQHAKNRRIKLGIENTGFQPIEAVEREMVNGKLVEPAESEVYFADVSSCCNISVKNDNYYEDANQRRSTNKVGVKEDENDYLSHRFGKREPSVRSRLPFPQMIPEDFDKSDALLGSTASKQMIIPVVPSVRTSLIHKDVSRQSMCSIDSGEKTDFTDLSPSTPSVTFKPYPNQSNIDGYNQQENFVASFPYNEQSQEAHRRSTKNLQEIFLAPDAQYETIKESNEYETTPLTLNYDHQHDLSSSSNSSSYSGNKSSPSLHYQTSSGSPSNNAIVTAKSPKSHNPTPTKRQNLGQNISAIIQNLNGNDIGLLYPENTNNGTNNGVGNNQQHTHLKTQIQDCNNDVISNIVVNSTNNCNNNNNNNNNNSISSSSDKQKEWSELNANDHRL